MKISFFVLAFVVSADAFSPAVLRKLAVNRFATMEDEIDFDGESGMTCLTLRQCQKCDTHLHDLDY
jgi:hypothetical protein